MTHLTAVSGSNVAVVIGAALLLAALLGLGTRGRAVLALLAIVGFAVLARPDPSVLRASVMGAVAVLAVASGRERAALPALQRRGPAPGPGRPRARALPGVHAVGARHRRAAAGGPAAAGPAGPADAPGGRGGAGRAAGCAARVCAGDRRDQQLGQPGGGAGEPARRAGGAARDRARRGCRPGGPRLGRRRAGAGVARVLAVPVARPGGRGGGRPARWRLRLAGRHRRGALVDGGPGRDGRGGPQPGGPPGCGRGPAPGDAGGRRAAPGEPGLAAPRAGCWWPATSARATRSCSRSGPARGWSSTRARTRPRSTAACATSASAASRWCCSRTCTPTTSRACPGCCATVASARWW